MINALVKKLATAAGLSTYKIGLLQTKAYRVLNQETARVLKPHSITPIDWALLGLLYDGPAKGMKLNLVALELGVEAPFITQQSENLIKLKFIKITQSDTDKRAKCMELTESGRKKVPMIEKALISTMMPLLKGCSIQELRGYRQTLTNIVKNRPEK